MPVDYLWSDTHTKSLGYLADTLAEYGGQRLQVQEVTFGGQPTDDGSFTVHPKTRPRVQDEAGAVKDVRLFGSMISDPASARPGGTGVRRPSAREIRA
jgi:hypothetical protein